jgi:hypothetical protein
MQLLLHLLVQRVQPQTLEVLEHPLQQVALVQQ